MKFTIIMITVFTFFLYISACNNQSEKSKNEIDKLKQEIVELKKSEDTHNPEKDEESKYKTSKKLEREYLSTERIERICETAYKNYLYEKNVINKLKSKHYFKEVFGIYNESSDRLLCAIDYDLEIHERNGFTEQNNIKKYFHVGRSDDELVLPVNHLTHELFEIELASIRNETKD